MKDRYRLIGNMLSSRWFTKLARNRIHQTSSLSQYSQFSPKYLNRLSTIWSTAIYRNTGFFLLSNLAFAHLHSTSTCLAHVTNTLLENIDKGLLTGVIFLDLSKAFDTLDHSIMLDKLTSLGLNRSAVQLFRSYLIMRTQSVCTNGVLSEPQSISFGVPQGSVLGPLLLSDPHN